MFFGLAFRRSGLSSLYCFMINKIIIMNYMDKQEVEKGIFVKNTAGLTVEERKRLLTLSFAPQFGKKI